MTDVKLDRMGDWARGSGVAALAALAWALFVPGGLVWSALFAAGLVGSAIAIAVIVHGRSAPSPAQSIARAEKRRPDVPTSCGYASGAGLRSRGERKP